MVIGGSVGSPVDNVQVVDLSGTLTDCANPSPPPDLIIGRQGAVVEGKPFTMDNYWSLQIDSVCKENGFSQLGITPRSVESQVPAYLANKGTRGRYDDYRRAAKRA